MKTPQQKEYLLQCHIVERHSQYFPHVLLTHIANRAGDATDAFFKKKMGVRPGVSDLAIWWLPDFLTGNTKKHYGLKPMQAGMVELKVDARVSTAQNKWLSAFAACGGYEGVAKSWQEYYKLLCSWGIKPTQECRIFDEPRYESIEDKHAAAHDLYKPSPAEPTVAPVKTPSNKGFGF